MGKHKPCQNNYVFELINNPLSRDGIVLNESIFRSKYVRAADSESRKLSGLLQMTCRNYAEQQLQHELHIVDLTTRRSCPRRARDGSILEEPNRWATGPVGDYDDRLALTEVRFGYLRALRFDRQDRYLREMR